MKKLIFIIILAFLTGCGAVRYVEVPVDRVSIEYRDRYHTDTLYRRDSIVLKERLDTVFLERYRYVYRTKVTRDTVSVRDTVTVSKPVEVVREVNRLRNWQVILMILGGVAVAFGIYRIVVFFRNRFNILK